MTVSKIDSTAARTNRNVAESLRDSTTSMSERSLDSFAETLQPAGGGGAVEDAMVEGQAEGDGFPDGELTVADDGFFDDPTDSENRGLRQIEDRREGVDIEAA